MSEQQNLNFQLSIDDTNVVLAGLGELPAKASFDLINKIKVQAGPQLQPQPQVEQAAPTQELLTETPAQ